MSNVTSTRLSEIREVQSTVHANCVYQTQSRVLAAECHTFAQYLVQQPPNSYVVAKYCDAHEKAVLFQSHQLGAFDRVLVTLARLHPLATRFADSYAAVFCRSAVVRRKMILLLAILESCAPTYSYFEAPESRQRVLLCSRLVARGLVFGLLLVTATLLLLPLQLLFTKLMPRV